MAYRGVAQSRLITRHSVDEDYDNDFLFGKINIDYYY